MDEFLFISASGLVDLRHCAREQLIGLLHAERELVLRFEHELLQSS